MLYNQSAVPVEILESVLDYFDDDNKGSLRACTLVCKFWLTSARRRLFRRLSSAGQNGMDAGKFLLDRLHGHPFPELVRVLSMYAFGQTLCTQHYLPQIMSKLSNLHELSIRGGGSQCKCGAVDRRIAPSLTGSFQLQRLLLSHVVHSCHSFFLDILNLFSDVKEVEIYGDTICSLPTSLEDARCLIEIRALNIRASTGGTTSCLLFRMIASSSAAHALHTLRASFACAADLEACAAVLPQCRNLRTVDFQACLTYDPRDQSAWDKIDLRSCDSLEKCAVRSVVANKGDIPDFRRSNNSLVNVLSRLPGSTRHVDIFCTRIGDALEECYDWTYINPILLGISDQLQSLTFSVHDENRTEAEALLWLKQHIEIDNESSTLLQKVIVRSVKMNDWW